MQIIYIKGHHDIIMDYTKAALLQHYKKEGYIKATKVNGKVIVEILTTNPIVIESVLH